MAFSNTFGVLASDVGNPLDILDPNYFTGGATGTLPEVQEAVSVRKENTLNKRANEGSSGNQKVKNTGKNARKQAASGGGNSYKSSVNKSGSSPSEVKTSYAVAPDYYRNGLFVNTTDNIAGEEVEVQTREA